MSDYYLGEIRLMAFNFAPKFWVPCNGQTMSIAQNQALFALLGTTYGGDGRTTFALPDLRGRTPMHFGDGWQQGQAPGQESHTLTSQEMPAHLHPVVASNQNANSPDAQGHVLAAATNFYRQPDHPSTLHPGTLPNVGGSQAHTNLSPYTTLNWCIATQGIFPTTF
jgi:microcystin-dependent protein